MLIRGFTFALGRHYLFIFILLLTFGCALQEKPAGSELVGAWRGKVQFKSGLFATVKDFEFMYVFNAGGTMTESSNYDGVPPVPPAYGVWKKTGLGQFEAKYEFYTNKAPVTFDDIAKGGGWMPSGWGVILEKITVSRDGRSFKSTIKFQPFDQTGKPIDGGGEAEADATRIDF